MRLYSIRGLKLNMKHNFKIWMNIKGFNHCNVPVNSILEKVVQRSNVRKDKQFLNLLSFSGFYYCNST